MNKDNVKLAIAPIGWTNDDMPELGSENTFQQIVSEMALAGFTGSEVGSKYPRDPAVLKPMLDIRGIQICNAWFSTFFANGQREKPLMNSLIT
jgi:inosose dehydratase